MGEGVRKPYHCYEKPRQIYQCYARGKKYIPWRVTPAKGLSTNGSLRTVLHGRTGRSSHKGSFRKFTVIGAENFREGKSSVRLLRS